MIFIIERVSLLEYEIHDKTDEEIIEKMEIPKKFRDRVQIKRENLTYVENYVNCYIEIQTLEELMDLQNDVGELIITDGEDVQQENMPKIKIYDDYIE